MVVLAAIALSAVAQAASMNWAIAAKVVGESPEGSASTGRASYYTALVFMASDASAVTAALTADGGVDYDTLTSKAVSTSQAGKSGAFGGAIANLSGSTATIFTVIFDTQESGDAIDLATYYLVSDNVTGNTYSGTDSPTTADFVAASFENAQWQAVPEPTSGLLLLLGVAGLALKRKRA